MALSILMLLYGGAGPAQARPSFPPIKILLITDATDPNSGAVMKSFRQKIAEIPTLLAITDTADAANVVFMEDCATRQAGEGYACFYTLHFAGGTIRSFMGAGIALAKTVDEMSAKLFGLMLQDITERYNDSLRSNAIDSLESCLFLTQSSCKVPDSLASELKADTLNLSQYLQKGGLKK